MTRNFVTIKKPEEISLIKQGGHFLGEILQKLGKMSKPGVCTGELEEVADKMIAAVGGRPSFKHYHSHGDTPYPTILCTSLDEEVVHTPSYPSRELKSGQILSIDIGMEWQGLFTDTAITVAIGKISKEARRLMDVTRKSLIVGIKAAKPGAKISDIGRVIQKYVEPYHFGIVRELVGHGVGYEVHEEPRVPNYYDPSLSNIEIKEGMVLAIEPMLTMGDWRIITGDDGWTIKTIDNSLAAHFEHTIVITKRGAEIATI